MLTLFCALILAGGVFVTLHPRFHFGFVIEACIAFAAMCAGGYIMGGDEIALFYCILAILGGFIYHTFKVFYDVMPERSKR